MVHAQEDIVIDYQKCAITSLEWAAGSPDSSGRQISYNAQAQTYALLAIAEALTGKAAQPEEEEEPTLEYNPVKCRDCGEDAEVEEWDANVYRCSCSEDCRYSPVVFGRTRAQAIQRWNAAARIK